ncbi:MAG: hypothetical protein WDZ69_00045 [Candidatus Pacearchaeota archaeon]
MTNKISFVTMGDSNYFPFIEININKLYPRSKIFIVNFGFIEKQMLKLFLAMKGTN